MQHPLQAALFVLPQLEHLLALMLVSPQLLLLRLRQAEPVELLLPVLRELPQLEYLLALSLVSSQPLWLPHLRTVETFELLQLALRELPQLL